MKMTILIIWIVVSDSMAYLFAEESFADSADDSDLHFAENDDKLIRGATTRLAGATPNSCQNQNIDLLNIQILT